MECHGRQARRAFCYVSFPLESRFHPVNARSRRQVEVHCDFLVIYSNAEVADQKRDWKYRFRYLQKPPLPSLAICMFQGDQDSITRVASGARRHTR